MTATIQPSGDRWAILLDGVPVASDHDQESAQTVADLMNQGLHASVAQANALWVRIELARIEKKIEGGKDGLGDIRALITELRQAERNGLPVATEVATVQRANAEGR